VIDTLLPSGADPRLPLGALQSGFDQFLAEFDAQAAPQLRSAFRWSLMASAWIAPLLVRRLPPVSRLSAADRTAALRAMERSKVVVLRQLIRVLKTVVALHYGAVPEVRQAIRYHA
jgi:hypothetical protein